MPFANKTDHSRSRPRKIRLGDHLLAQQIITQDQLNAALKEQKTTGKRLGAQLVEQGVVSEEQFLNFLARQLDIEYIDLNKFPLNPEIIQLIPEIHARRFHVIALEEKNDALHIGMADPTDIVAYDEIGKIVNRPLQISVLKESQLFNSIDKYYRNAAEIKGLAEEADLQLAGDSGSTVLGVNIPDTPDAPLVKLLRTMLEDAVKINASDIHIEPEHDETRIRFRIDGALHIQTVTSKRLASALLSRLKLMAGLDISEKRLPQDGRFNFTVKQNHIDVRLSTMPMQYGETAVMRLLNQTIGIPDLGDTGMSADILHRFRRSIFSPHGIVLVTGPTGSGKTTTLYSALKELNEPHKKIVTIEDPIEYRLPGITQIQVNAKIDLSFARVLRSLLRHDPDIVLIGEMRDQETVETALRTAMTGHFVLSTLHTNDAISSIGRLIDMGAPPYLVAASLRGVLTQRLVKKICQHCAEVIQPDEAQYSLMKNEINEINDEPQFQHGTGCTQCNQTGYHGRTSIAEYLELDKELAGVLQSGNLQDFETMASRQQGFRSLKSSALDMAAKGITTIEEVMRTCYGIA